MPPFKPCPLLRLPLLVMQIVIKQMDHKELFPLSLTSRKAYFYVKTFHTKSSKLAVNLNGRKKSSVNFFEPGKVVLYYISVLEGTLDSSETRITVGGISAEIVKNETRDDHYITFWEDKMLGIRVMAEHLLDLFELRIDAVYVGTETVWMMDYVENRQGKSTYKAIIGQNQEGDRIFPDEEFRKILERDPRELLIQAVPRSESNFRIKNFKKKYESLTVYCGSWVTLDNLKTLNAAKIQIHGKRFGNEMIEELIGHWVAGGSPNLKYLKTDTMPTYTLGNLMRQYNGTKILGQQRFRVYEGEPIMDRPEIAIRRHGDRVVATIGFKCMEIGVHDFEFRFRVWPDVAF